MLFERREQPIIDGQEVELGKPCEESWIGAINSGDDEFIEQSRCTDVVRGEPTATGALDEGRGEEGFADAGAEPVNDFETLTDTI